MSKFIDGPVFPVISAIGIFVLIVTICALGMNNIARPPKPSEGKVFPIVVTGKLIIKREGDGEYSIRIISQDVKEELGDREGN